MPDVAADPSAAGGFRTTVTSLGADGDGIARAPDGTSAYIAYTLADEIVLARALRRRGEGWVATAESIERPSVDRVPPPCPHFGRCGGCALQHWRDAPMVDWKAQRVARALGQAGFAWTPQPALATPPNTRRRMDLALRRLPSGVVVGLHVAGGTDVIAIEQCRVLHPRLLSLLPALRDTLDRLAGLRREGSALLNLLDTGPDLLLRHDAALTAPDRQRLAAFATAHQIPRIATSQGRATQQRPWEIACQFGAATIAFAGIAVTPPPGAFLQASAEGEAAISAAVCAGLPDRLPASARVAELFAGCGSLTFPLARRVRVAAFEGDAAAASCLAAGARTAGRISVTTRDLVRQPLAVAELKGFAAIVLDPPFNGAAAQMPGIAASGVGRIVYVSCHPAALARDAGFLASAGYKMVSAVAIDQFVWSPHVESVITFQR